MASFQEEKWKKSNLNNLGPLVFFKTFFKKCSKNPRLASWRGAHGMLSIKYHPVAGHELSLGSLSRYQPASLAKRASQGGSKGERAQTDSERKRKCQRETDGNCYVSQSGLDPSWYISQLGDTRRTRANFSMVSPRG